MILLKEKEKKKELVRKNLQFDLSDQDQKMAFQILNSKRGDELKEFVSKSVILYEYILQKKRRDEILKRGKKMEREIDDLKIFSSTTSRKTQTKQVEQKEEIIPEIQETTHTVQNVPLELNVQNEPIEQNVQNAQNVQTSKNTTNDIQNNVADRVNVPVREEINIQSQPQETLQEEKINSPMPETMAVEENLDEDIFANAMSFLSNMQ